MCLCMCMCVSSVVNRKAVSNCARVSMHMCFNAQVAGRRQEMSRKGKLDI